MATQITPGTKVTVVKGCPALGIRKGSEAVVVQIDTPGGHLSKVRMELAFFSVSESGRTTKTLWAYHPNRLYDEVVHLHGIGPRDSVQVARLVKIEELPPSSVAAYDQMLRNIQQAAAEALRDPNSFAAGKNIDGACREWLEARESVQRG